MPDAECSSCWIPVREIRWPPLYADTSSRSTRSGNSSKGGVSIVARFVRTRSTKLRRQLLKFGPQKGRLSRMSHLRKARDNYMSRDPKDTQVLMPGYITLALSRSRSQISTPSILVLKRICHFLEKGQTDYIGYFLPNNTVLSSHKNHRASNASSGPYSWTTLEDPSIKIHTRTYLQLIFKIHFPW